jgi:rubrerythrin
MFSKTEILNLAISIEEAGIEFYKEAESMVNQNLKELFKFLQEEELAHKNIFEKMLQGLQDFSITYKDLPDDYNEYVKAIGQGAVFKKIELHEKIKGLSSQEKIVSFALEMERKSIEYYNFLKEITPQKNHPLLDQIIAEEEKHITQLENMKKNLR